MGKCKSCIWLLGNEECICPKRCIFIPKSNYSRREYNKYKRKQKQPVSYKLWRQVQPIADIAIGDANKIIGGM